MAFSPPDSRSNGFKSTKGFIIWWIRRPRRVRIFEQFLAGMKPNKARSRASNAPRSDENEICRTKTNGIFPRPEACKLGRLILAILLALVLSRPVSSPTSYESQVAPAQMSHGGSLCDSGASCVCGLDWTGRLFFLPVVESHPI